MKKMNWLGLLILWLACNQTQQSNMSEVRTGADMLLAEKFDLIRGQRLGVITNHSALLRNGVHLVDTLFHRNEVTLVALFAPEHGIRGDAPDGDSIAPGRDPRTGIPVFSLYQNEYSRPESVQLKNIDRLVYDIQDVGVRFYTYISTLFNLIQLSAETGIPLLVLDRPNPIGGLKVDGPILKPGLESFVGIAPLPIMYGMTVGELARLFNESGMLGANRAELTVVEMENWRREMYFDATGLMWRKPSPNIPRLENALVYPGTCLIEGLNVSEGRGTPEPFLTIGAPFIRPVELIAELERQQIKGIQYEPLAAYIPVEIPNTARAPKYENQSIPGIRLRVTQRRDFEPVQFGIALICALQRLNPGELVIDEARFNRLSGDRTVREKILSGASAEEIVANWQAELEAFKSLRQKYLLY